MKEKKTRKKRISNDDGLRTKPNISKNGFKMDNINVDIHSAKYDQVEAEEIINEKMGIYGANINLVRAFPNVRDGLTETQRIILYTGYKEGFRYNKEYKKSLRYIGSGSVYYVHGK